MSSRAPLRPEPGKAALQLNAGASRPSQIIQKYVCARHVEMGGWRQEGVKEGDRGTYRLRNALGRDREQPARCSTRRKQARVPAASASVQTKRERAVEHGERGNLVRQRFCSM